MHSVSKVNTGALIKKRLIITVSVAITATVICVFFYYLMSMNVSHTHVYFLFTILVSFLVLTYMILWILSADKKYSRVVKISKRCYFICLLIGILFFSMLQALIISGSFSDEDADVDALIILGAGLINSTPSLILASRLNAAIRYAEMREDVIIVVTGGLGQGQVITEAEAMARYLIARGIDESLILKEEKSTNSHENIRFAMEVMKENGINPEDINVAVVTNDFHLYRAKLIAEKAGFNTFGIAAETPGFHRKVIYHFREAFSLVNQWLFR